MASNVVRVSLLADAKGFKKGMGEAERAATGFEKTAGTVSKAIGGFFALAATKAVVDFAKDSIRAFSELEQATGSVESVFGDAAGTIIDMSKKAADEFGLSASEFQQNAALLGSQLKNQLGLSAEEAAGKIDELMGRASDMAATFGGTTADAVSAISGLLRGERDAIEKYGVSMNDAAVSAKALEMGLADSSKELTPQLKSAAALELLYEQTADSAGQFADETDTVAGKLARSNAKMEDQKALLGQSLVPLYGSWLGLLQKITPEIGNLALGIGEVTGALTETETAIAEWEAKTGRAAETAADWLEALSDDVNIGKFREWLGHAPTMTDEFTNKILDGIAAWSLGTDELALLAEQFQLLYDVGKISKEQLDLITGAIQKKEKALEQANLDVQRGRGREEEYAAALRGEKDAQVKAKDATYDHIDAIKELRDEIRGQTDPMFAYQEAFADVEAAQRDVIQAEKDYGKGSPEHIDALNKARDAALDFKDAELELADQGGVTADELKTHLRSLRIYTEDQIDLMIREFERINAFKFRAKTIAITHKMTGGGVQEFQSGGVVQGPPGAAVPIIAHAGETILPTRRHDTGQNGHGGMVANITINAGMGADPNAISKAVVQALQRYERANGAIPIKVRPAS